MKYDLKYLFVAVYNDGTHYQQTPEDVSLTKRGGSAFSDVDHTRLVRFFLASETNSVSVDLVDGHFEINGVPFRLHNEDDGFKDFKLHYWRQVTRNFEVGSRPIPKDVSVIYKIGWECEKDGVTHKRVIEIE